jgi:hypothetical protein
VLIQVDGEPQTKLVEVNVDGVAEVVGSAKGAAAPESASPEQPTTTPNDAKPPEVESARGLPPVYFYAGVGLTTVLAGLTTYFAFDTASKHGDFKDAGCDRANYAACSSLKSDGEGAQMRTNVSLVLTLLSGAATTIVGLKLTNWRAPLLGLHPGGGMVGYRATF